MTNKQIRKTSGHPRTIQQEVPLTMEQHLRARLLRRQFAVEFRKKRAIGKTRNEIRDIAILARDYRNALWEAGITDSKKELLNLTIGDIDWRLLPKAGAQPIGEQLGLDPKGKLARKIYHFIENEELSHRNAGTETLWGYQPEATGYVPTRRAFADFISSYGIRYSPEETVLSYGSLTGIDGLLASLQVMARRERRRVNLVFPAPGFAVISAQAHRRDIPVTTILTHNSVGYSPTDEQLRKALRSTVGDKTILYLTPMNNPTSTVYRPKVLRAAVGAFRALRPNGVLLVDLAYVETIDEEQAKTLLRIIQNASLTRAVVLATSMSKMFGKPRLRAGALHAKDAALLRELQVHWQTVYASTAGPVELEALARWQLVSKKARLNMYRAFRQRQQKVRSILMEVNRQRRSRNLPPMIETEKIYQDVPLYMYVKLSSGISFLDLFEEAGILGIPGEVFGDTKERNMVRFAMGMEQF